MQAKTLTEFNRLKNNNKLNIFTTRQQIFRELNKKCIMAHFLEYTRIFILNPEYGILFWNNLLGAKWADHTEV